jgi:hypothetical protein
LKAERENKEKEAKEQAERKASGVVMNNNPVAARPLPSAATRL